MNMEDRAMNLIRLPEVKRITGLSRSTIYLLMRKGKFPEPIKITAVATAWLETEVSAWIQSRIEARDKRGQSGRSLVG
ncbi:MAG: helix-turn-helix transcriptional regulator [Gammaproteobacteria bacterium]